MATHDLQKELDELKADIRKMRADFSSMHGTLKDEITKLAGNTGEEIAATAEHAKDAFKNRVKYAKRQGREALEEVEGRVADHPLGSLTAAFGLGFVVAKLMNLNDR